ncbi:MAG: SAM-dependent methyltransferase [Bacteroidales bacterium]|nr:SAM-dependent methyltransferase [Bacteroidales bacterium]
MTPSLYLIPVTLGETEISRVIPDFNIEITKAITYFIVEDIRSARRFLKKSISTIDIDSLTFFELNKHTSSESISDYLLPLKKGFSVGVLSEAGCPAIADPGAVVVSLAQQNGYKVIPLVGPSSILMALMASGFNGQSFAFHGYLPIESSARIATIKKLEQRIYNEDQTQIFIETPYRNHKLIDDLLKNCRPLTKLCIAANVTCVDEFIRTKTIKEWFGKIPELSKIPTVFVIYK